MAQIWMKMMMNYLSITFGISLILHMTVIYGFNINTRTPRVFSEGGGFGYSLAMYSINGSKSLIVGAPLEDDLNGTVYICPFVNIPRNECSRIPFNMKLPPPAVGTATRAQGFLGASVMAAPDGLVVACAPRTSYHYKKFLPSDKEQILMAGACFVYDGSENKYLPPFIPCRKGVHGYSNEHLTCAAGFSVSPLENKEDFVLGGLGTDGYKGGFIRMEKDAYNRPDYGERGDEAYDYMGYAVSSGRFAGQATLDVVAGSPKGANDSGMVRVFHRLNSGGWRSVGEPLYGPQFGSYFGSVMAVGDFNGDKLDDIAIGAPYYTDINERIANMGQVQIFYQREGNTQSSQKLFHHDSTTLKSPHLLSGKFSASLAALKDINMDSFDDLAVGEPYGGPDNRGVVYIYHGSSKGIKTKPVQMILAEDFSLPVQGLGSSIAGNIDMDGNGYPDLAIGAYRSSHAAILLAHPVANVSIEIDINPRAIMLQDDCDVELPPGAASCANVTTRVLYRGNFVPNAIDLKITWTPDSSNISDELAYFADHGKGPMSENLRVVKDQQVLLEHVLFFGNAIVKYDKQLGIVVSYELQKSSQAISDPVINPMLPQNIRAGVDIHRSPADVKIQVNSSLQSLVLAKDGEVDVIIEVENLSDEPAYEVDVTMESTPGILYYRSDSPNSITCFITEEEKFMSVCDLGFVLTADSNKMIFTVFLSIANPEYLYNSSAVSFTFNLTSVNDENLANNVAELTLPLVTDSAIKVIGTSDPDQIQIKDRNQTVTHVYEVSCMGKSSLQHLNFWISWPVRTTEEVPLLSFEHGPLVVKGPAHCETEQPNIDSVEPCQSDTPTVLCVRFRCQSDVLESGQQIVINMTGDVPPEIKALSKKDNTFVLTSYIEVEGRDILDDRTLVRDISEISTSVVFLGVERKEQVETWILAVSIACGVLAFVILVIILWKVGFFKRKTKEQLFSAKRKSMESNWTEGDPRDRIGSAADDPEEIDDMATAQERKDMMAADLNDNKESLGLKL